MYRRCLAIILALGVLAVPALSDVTVYEDEDSYIDLGMLIQFQYRANLPEYGKNTSDVFFRRLRPMIRGAFHEDWQGIIELDFGAGMAGADYGSNAGGSEYDVSVRWVNMQYIAMERSHITVGSFKSPFSREFLTHGARLQGIERTFVGLNDYGTPDYMLGIGYDYMMQNRKIAYYVAFGAQNQNPEAVNMQFRSPANGASTFNQGYMLAGRIDFFPVGEMPYSVKQLDVSSAYNRGDFHTQDWRYMLSVGAYGWQNDGDNNQYSGDGSVPNPDYMDLKNSCGAEVSGGIRGFGFSGDIEYQYIRGRTEESGFTGGLYEDGSTDLNKLTVNGGYMLYANQLELLAAWSYLNADNYDQATTVGLIGLNWFVREYAVRFSTTYRIISNANGMQEGDGGVFRLQAQFAW